MAALTYPQIDPVIFAVGPFAVRWYGVAYVAGFIVAILIVARLNRRWEVGLSEDDLFSMFIYGSLGLVIGARVGYMLFYALPALVSDPLSLFRVAEGGMSFHGGLAGILFAGYLLSRRISVPMLRLADLVAVGAPIGIFFGRVANFINGELWGRVTEVPWGMVFPRAGPLPRHPSQLYEALLEGVLLFAVMLVVARRRRPDGYVTGWLLVLYGIMRFLVEFVREPDAHLGAVLGPLSMGQLLTVPVFAAGAWLLWRARAASGTGEKRA
ncbi:MAG: prolipoprotein diacylglyceryl transferase [Anaerosomatales bacterium]|nr:prolipoprotein diacylglyceryl transferase [Anaerosomatales bacterium]MDT8433149.1 prolipoprotein diacylglyceryl transferase [Anaerosomatales bacterium]